MCRHCNAPFQEAERCRSHGDAHAADCPRFATARGQEAEEVERLRKALQEAEHRIHEQVQLRQEQLRRKDEQICRLTLQLQPDFIDDTKTVAVEFADEGSLGLITDELQPEGPGVYVVGIKGQAARLPQVQPGMRIVGVAGRSCVKMRYRDITQMIKTHTARPLIITFALPEGPPSTPPSIGGGHDFESGLEPDPAPEPEPDCTLIPEGVPPPSAPPPVAMLRRLSADAGRIVASAWREQRRSFTDTMDIPTELISAGFPPWKCRIALAQTTMRTAAGELTAALDYLERHQEHSDKWWRELQARDEAAHFPVKSNGGTWVDVDKSGGT